jgi:hypothetical protein
VVPSKMKVWNNPAGRGSADKFVGTYPAVP